jgi:hypothetical protein
MKLGRDTLSTFADILQILSFFGITIAILGFTSTAFMVIMLGLFISLCTSVFMLYNPNGTSLNSQTKILLYMILWMCSITISVLTLNYRIFKYSEVIRNIPMQKPVFIMSYFTLAISIYIFIWILSGKRRFILVTPYIVIVVLDMIILFSI